MKNEKFNCRFLNSNLKDFKEYRIIIYKNTNQLQLLVEFFAFNNDFDFKIIKVTQLIEYKSNHNYYVLRLENFNKKQISDLCKYINDNYLIY